MHLPWGSALAAPVGSLGGLFTQPLFTLGLQHVEASCRASPGGGGYLPSTWSVLQGTAPCPSPSWFPKLTCPPWLPALWWLEPYLSYSHIFLQLICGIYRK